jgi:hypothetical protein
LVVGAAAKDLGLGTTIGGEAKSEELGFGTAIGGARVGDGDRRQARGEPTAGFPSEERDI